MRFFPNSKEKFSSRLMVVLNSFRSITKPDTVEGEIFEPKRFVFRVLNAAARRVNAFEIRYDKPINGFSFFIT